MCRVSAAYRKKVDKPLRAGSAPLNEPADPSRDSLEALLAERAAEHVTYAGWEAIDAAEKAAGESHAGSWSLVRTSIAA